MTPEEKKILQKMQVMAVDHYESEYANRAEEIAAMQAYAFCVCALQLDRIASLMEQVVQSDLQ